MKDTAVVKEELPKREPIVVNRDVWYSFVSKEDADPQACWLERKRQERIKAAKAALEASTSPTSFCGSLVVDSSKFGNVQQKVNRNMNKTPSPPSSLSSISTEEDRVPRVNPRESSPKAYLSDDSSSGIKVNRHKGPSPPSSVVSSNEDDFPGKFSLKDDNLHCDSPSGIKGSNGKHFAKIGHYLNHIHQKEKLCDISFRLDNTVFPTHKVVLASQSKLFERIFQSETFTELPSSAKQIKVKGVSEEALDIFIDCIYSGNMSLIKPECLPDILQLSQVFEVEPITRMCYKIVSSFCEEDILRLLPKSRKFGDVKVCDIIIDVISKKFLDIRNCPSFFDLDFHSLCLILLNDGLNVNSEVEVFDTAVSWLHHHNVEERLKHLDQVMDTIRFSLLSHKDLMACFRKCPALKQSPHCVGLITMANWVQTSMDLKQQDPLNLEASKHRNVDIIGPSVEQYLSTHFNPDMKKPDVSFDIIPLTEDSLKDFNLHACLGSQSWSTVSAAHVQQYSETKWSMNDNAMNSNQGKQNDKVLAWLQKSSGQARKPQASVFNHWDHNHPKPNLINGLQSMDCMMGRKPKQKHAPKMEGKSIVNDKHVKKKRRERDKTEDISDGGRHCGDYQKAMVWGGDQWYMVGGARYNDSECPSPTNKVLVYSYETKEWRPVAPLNVARVEHTLCEVDGYIFAIGGIGEGNRLLSSVECFNPRTNCWFYVKALPEPRASASASAEGGNVCLKGGYSEIKNGQPSSFYYDNEVELFYNMETNKWIRRS